MRRRPNSTSLPPAAAEVPRPPRPGRAKVSVRPANVAERPRREDRVEHSERVERSEAPADEPVDIDSIPPQFLYVRPGVTFVPTPRNWGGAPA